MPASTGALEFRPARPDDAAATVPLVYSSGPAAFDFVFGHDRPGAAREFLRFAFAEEAGEFSYRTHTLAVRDGRVVAAGAAFDGRAGLRFMLAAASQILRFYGPARGAGVIARGLRAERIIRPPSPDEYYVCHLGVEEGARGLGIGSALIRHLLAAAHGHAAATLDVAATNPRAEALYARLGFVVSAERPSRLGNRYGRLPDHRRMRLPLPPRRA